MPCVCFRAQCEHMLPFGRGKSLGLKEEGWPNQSIVRHLDRKDYIIGDADKNRQGMSKYSVKKAMVDTERRKNVRGKKGRLIRISQSLISHCQRSKALPGYK